MNIGKIIPIELNETTAYLAGVIVGDGHISNSQKSKTDKSRNYRVVIELTDRAYLEEITSMIKGIVQTKSEIKEVKLNKNVKKRSYFQLTNKSFYYFLTSDLGIPAGKKSFIVRIPEKILDAPNLIWSFLSGLFDTDGGIRGRTVGFTSASKQLIKDISLILKNEGFEFTQDTWRNKLYNSQYYGIKIWLRSNDRFLNKLTLRNLNKRKRVFRHADVPEWSNGTGLQRYTKNTLA